jgi:hypothetical protein
MCPGKNPCQRAIGIVGLPQGCLCQPVSPFEEHRLRTWIVQRLDREIAESPFDPFNLLDVVTLCAWRDPELKIGALLETEQQCQQYASRWRYLLGGGFIVGVHELR